MVYQNSVIIAGGQDPEHGEGVGHLWRIDATKTGDLSKELGAIGQKGRPNPNSGIIWHYGGGDDENYIFRRTLSSPAITSDGLLYITDLSGYLHCLNVRTGKRKWEFDMLSGIWGSPVLFRDRLLIGDEDGNVNVFNATAAKHEPFQFGTTNYHSIYATIHIDGDSAFVTTRNSLTKFDFAAE